MKYDDPTNRIKRGGAGFPDSHTRNANRSKPNWDTAVRGKRFQQSGRIDVDQYRLGGRRPGGRCWRWWRGRRIVIFVLDHDRQ